MQNAKSGAPKHRGRRGAGDVLTPAELRGMELKRVVRAAAALRDLYDDVAIGQAVGRTRMTVAGWWRGAVPSPDPLRALAEAVGLPIEELTAFVYFDGPPPRVVAPESPADAAIREGIRRDQDDPPPVDPPALEPSHRRRPRGSGR